ncbi:hypothetical protein B0H17DRAFT_1214035 [Mycena rosella]|uniref:Uncharacterized protein n=1 Tax=Mycena rosella TaxID=1033263 RepID=A0AAD7G4I6_MYCRO|nr:hypothetical protein B0H17DRAFT_1214035 [Mycena rosella]
MPWGRTAPVPNPTPANKHSTVFVDLQGERHSAPYVPFPPAQGFADGTVFWPAHTRYPIQYLRLRLCPHHLQAAELTRSLSSGSRSRTPSSTAHVVDVPPPCSSWTSSSTRRRTNSRLRAGGGSIEDTALEAAFKRQMYSDPPATQVSPMAIPGAPPGDSLATRRRPSRSLNDQVSVHPVAAPSPSPPPKPTATGAPSPRPQPTAARTMPTFASSSSASATSTASDSTSTRAQCRQASGLQSPVDRTAPAKPQ